MILKAFVNIILSGFFLLNVNFLQGQVVAVAIKDSENTPLVGATVHLTNAADSARVSMIADQAGVARFNQVNQGVYLVNISYVGYQPLEKTILVKNGNQNFEYKLQGDAIALGEVTVTARRPLMRQDGDKMIIDPEPIASFSTNTLEILESTPGLFVDQDGGIFLNSATPATIFINGREQKMSSQDINTILRSLPPGSVQQIEVIRTPSARYSASSSGGIINIVLKKGIKIGRFGSLNSGMNQGNYGNQFLGFSINNGGVNTSSYLNLNISNNDMLEELNSTRLLSTETSLLQSAQTRRQARQAYAGYGLSYEASEKIVLSYDGRLNGSLPRNTTQNTNLINAFNDEPVSRTDNFVNNNSEFLNLQQDLGLVFKLDTIGSEWDTKFSYSYNYNDAVQNYRTGQIFPVVGAFLGNGDNLQRRHYFQFQSDLTYRLPLKITMEVGVNSTLQDFRSQSDFFVKLNGNQMNDPLRTNSFNYDERINAGYLQISRSLPWDLLLKAGVRMEHTFMEGNQTIPGDTSFVVNRADWFPFVYLSRPLFAIAGFELRSFLIYRKSITRPGYQSLNPYINYVDQFLYEAGNPGLKPQFTENYEANISMDDMPIFAIGRSYTRDIFSSVIYQDVNQANVAIRTYDNLGQNKETYFRAIAGIPPVNRYFFVAGAQYNLNEYEGVYEGQPLTYTRGSWRFFTFHALRITPNTRLNMSGFMMTSGLFNFYELNTFGQLNLSLNQTFLNKRLTVTLSARDVLRTMVNDFQLNQGSIVSYGSRYTDNRRFGINIRYTFGIPDKRERQNPMQFDMEE